MRPPEADPPGLGKSLQEALSYSPQQLSFMLAGKDEVTGLVRQMRKQQNDVDLIMPETVTQSVREHMQRLREQYTGRSTVD